VFAGTTDALATFPPPFKALALTILPVEVVGDNTLPLTAGLLPLRTERLLAVAFASELLTPFVPVVPLAVLSTLLTGLATPLGSVLGVPVATTEMPLGAAAAVAALFGVVALTVRPEAGFTTLLAPIVPLGVVALAPRLAVLPVVYNEPSTPLPPGVVAPAASEPLTPESALLTGSVAPARGLDPLLPDVPPEALLPDELPDEPFAEVPPELPGLAALDVPDDPELPAPAVCGELPPDDAAPGVSADEPHPLAASRMTVSPVASASLETGVTMLPSRSLGRRLLARLLTLSLGEQTTVSMNFI
jgi:hypothetical protein